MQVTCKNCGQTYSGHFCNNCGQHAATHKLNLHFIWHDIQHGFFHFDKGVLYTAKELFTRPGDSIRDFVEGKRVKHFKPISLVIILATSYRLLRHLFHFSVLDKKALSSFKGVSSETANEWISHHYAWIILLSIPLFSLASYLVFKRQGYNFIEHLVLNAYVASQKLLLRIAIFPLTKFLNDTPAIKVLVDFLLVIEIGLMVWTYMTFFDNISRNKALLYALLSYVVFFIIFLVLVTLVVVLFGIKTQ